MTALSMCALPAPVCPGTVISQNKLLSANLWFDGRMEGRKQEREHKRLEILCDMER